MLTITTLPWPRVTTKKAKEITIQETLLLEQWQIPAYTTIKIRETENFGYVILPHGAKDVRGVEIPKRLFQY